jgi:hypothetical protein
MAGRLAPTSELEFFLQFCGRHPQQQKRTPLVFRLYNSGILSLFLSLYIIVYVTRARHFGARKSV